MEGARVPEGGAEERRRASSRENSPQAHMAELKHPYAGKKQKTFSVSMLQMSQSQFLWSFCVLMIWFILFTTPNPSGVLTVVGTQHNDGSQAQESIDLVIVRVEL